MLSKGFRISKLGAELVLAALISAAISLGLFAGLDLLGYRVLDRILIQEDVVSAREKEYMENLQTYITENGLSSNDTALLDIWANEKKDLIITLYKDRAMIYSSDERVAVTVSQLENENSSQLKEEGRIPEGTEESQEAEEEIPWVYRLQFSDGPADAVLSFYFESYYYTAMLAFNGVIGILAFIVLLFLFIHTKVKYISLLEREIQILQGGDLNYAITIRGQDELTSLASEINSMRLAVLDRQEEEEKARNANRDLVTVMSHDLRTPLTSLLGYVDILQMGRCGDEEQYHHYLAAVRNKAYQIKEMSDKLFEYFIVYGKEEEELELAQVNGTEFLGQIVEESLFDMESEGFTIKRESDEIRCRLMADVRLVRRVFDNIFSNLLKYADRSRPVTVAYHQDRQHLLIRFTNYVAEDLAQKESSCIGLKTCEKIMSCHTGAFRCRREGELFTAELEFPILEDSAH